MNKSDLEASPSNGVAFSFGPFRLIPTQQLLLEDDKPVRVGSRALDILIALVERRGEIVSKEELVRQVWPDTFVEEGNLRVHIAALRRVLGDDQPSSRCIANVAGRGYRFVAPVVAVEMPTQIQAGAVVHPAHNLPPPLARMIGRREFVRNLVTQFSRRRFITISGPGGIGKTAVALAVAHELVASFAEGVCFVDLAPLSDPALVVSTLASALDTPIRIEAPLPRLLAHLLDKKMLLVFDNCERVIDAAAGLAEEVLKAAPGVRILTTSQEPLSAEGEAVVRLAPLGAPPAATGITAFEGLTYPALQLFVERAAFCLDDFELTDADAPAVAEICRRLDGIPLAIELAAGRIDALGVRGLAEQLNNRFGLLTRGRRTALPRHQTLRATLDWSHDLLSVVQKVVFRRLGVFAGWFTAKAAAVVVCGEDLSASDLISVIADLTAKSLVTAEIEGPVAHYRLLETTRAYAFERLVDADEVKPVLRLHADYYRKLMETAEQEWEWEVWPTKDWLTMYARRIDDVRAALDWAFSSNGDVAIGIALTAAAVPLWHQLSLFNECSERLERALSALDAGELRNDVLGMKLHAARGWSFMIAAGPSPASGSAWTPAYKFAEDLNNTDYRLRSLWGLWAGKIHAEFTSAYELAEQFCRLASDSDNPNDCHIGNGMMGASLHLLGDQPGARDYIERMLSSYIRPPHRSDLVRYLFDQRVTAKITLSRVLWLQGFAEQALSTVDSGVAEALSLEHALTLCYTLAQGACPVALLAGDFARAERFITMLLHQTELHAFGAWRACGDCYRGQLLARRGDYQAGLALIRAAVEELRRRRYVEYCTASLIALAGAGEAAAALDAIDEALALSQRSGERWCTAEMLRIKGEALLQLDGSGSAEAYFLESLEMARQQQALAWELRTATSLTRLKRGQDRASEGHELLASVVGRFSEGFATEDLLIAKSLLSKTG